ncbi:MAG: hypothetical protein V5A52_09235 [Halovenus sp.]|uniref:hypothetical protein n=1 Tax=Halovenus amylolytica TaxID=2500550 RepID=UPI000FE3C216
MTEELTPPAAPEADLERGGWEQTEIQRETLFEMPAMRIRGVTRRYEDQRTRDALRVATDGQIDQQLRFFAVTRLSFEPPPPPGVSPTMFAPTLRSEARRTFKTRLEERGLVDIEEGNTERIRLPDRSRARLTCFSATDSSQGAFDLPLECWVAVWTSSGTVRIVTGGYPAVTLDSHFDLDSDEESLGVSPDEYRREFVSLLRGVAEKDQ